MDKDKAKILGNLLKQLRTSKNVTQEELANKLKVPQSYISMLEGGRKLISTTLLFKIVDIFQVSLDYFDVNKNSSNFSSPNLHSYMADRFDRLEQQIEDLRKTMDYFVKNAGGKKL